MDNGIISGYVCTTKGDRQVHRWIMIALWLVFFGSTAVLIWQAVLDGKPIFWVFILGWVIFYTVIMHEGYCIRYVNDIAFVLKPSAAENIYPKALISLDIPQIRYVSVLTCQLSPKAPQPEMPFYLLSAEPIVDAQIEYEGLKWISRLQKHNIVIIPQNKMTDEWIANTLKIKNVSAYPKQEKLRTEDGLL